MYLTSKIPPKTIGIIEPTTKGMYIRTSFVSLPIDCN